MSNQTGALYVVATPIGNLEDISDRARAVLAAVDLIAVEDTRHSKKLLSVLGIKTPMQAYHDFNERDAAAKLLERLKQGRDIALISDAGTPLINDPGYHIVSMAHEHNIRVIPVPGPSALICALSASGLPVNRFTFEGYAPEKQAARRQHMQMLCNETRTIVFYETPHRIMAFMEDAIACFGPDRVITIARELTKKYETIRKGTLTELQVWMRENEEQCKGEFVVLIEGVDSEVSSDEAEIRRILAVLLRSLPVKEAAAMAAEITGGKKNDLYKLALVLKDQA